ncbi:MAG: acyl transferase [Bacteroidetes bacterium]|nr:acyl transferase [Fibrella sp.]
MLRERIVSVTDAVFEELALAVFEYQATHNPLYREYLTHLGIQPDGVTSLPQVPFMPIGFFKTQTIVTGQAVPALTFASSGTTEAQQTSRHLVSDVGLYDAVSRRIFERVYGPLENVHILALLPSYLERNNSSLVYMVQRFMAHTRDSAHSNFYLNNLDELTAKLRWLTESQTESVSTRKILLIGVTFGLLDWAELDHDLTFLGRHPRLIVMETGGMKGRRKELLREEVHAILMQRLGVPAIHSEYGMTELLSQAYSPGGGVFYPGPTMRVFLRDINDPFAIFPSHSTRTGGINVVDLANLDSCAFIETQDLGQYEAGPMASGLPNAFRVIGRFDNSDVRGCNLMVP